MVSESIAAAGSSRAENLYELLVQLHCLCMRRRCQVVFIHVSETQIIGQGTDGFSRVSFYEGVMNVKPILSFLPLGDSVLKRSNKLGVWIYQWASDLGTSVDNLDP